MKQIRLTRIVSGGQTGVDRAALDVALRLRVSHGGWCPRGRRAEDGVIDDHYQLIETEEREYRFRTERNVIDSDATLILYRHKISGGTLLTKQYAKTHDKELECVDLAQPAFPELVLHWIMVANVSVLNVAGPRESTSPGIYQQAYDYFLKIVGSIVQQSS